MSWELWRQDDHGNEFRVRAFDERAAAERARDEMVARGHHQHYWVLMATSGSDWLARLAQHVVPPQTPVRSNTRIEADGRVLELPSDYAALMEAYGPGSIEEYVFVLSVGDSLGFYDMVRSMQDSALELAEHRELLGNRWPPYPLWPAEGALVKWGTVANEHELFWLTEGDPEEWPIVVLRVDEQLHEFVALSTTAFLVQLFEGPAPSELVGMALSEGTSEFSPCSSE